MRDISDSSKRTTAVEKPRHAELVQGQFEAGAQFWTDVYEDDSLHGLIYRDRRDALLAWVDALHMPPFSAVLEVGSGGGNMAIELARRGFLVNAVDIEPRMVKATLRQAHSAGVQDDVVAGVADAHALPFDESTFCAVVTVAVIQWLDSPELALGEMARVIVPGGHLVATFANPARLDHFFDPRTNPYVGPLRRWIAGILEFFGLPVRRDRSLMRFDRRNAVASMLTAAGLEQIDERTIGFGPFTCLGISRSSGGKRIHSWLQRMANANFPVIRSAGADFLVLARKPQLVTSPE